MATPFSHRCGHHAESIGTGLSRAHFLYRGLAYWVAAFFEARQHLLEPADEAQAERPGISFRDFPPPIRAVPRRATLPHMTNDKFRELCEKVLIPRIGDLLHPHLIDVSESLDIYAKELIRIGDRLDKMAAWVDRTDGHADHG